MLKRLSWLAAGWVITWIASCGGGGSTPTVEPATAAPLIRYQGSWRGSIVDSTTTASSATLTLQALPGQATISTHPVARVEVQLGTSAPSILTAANSTDAQGRPQYRFDAGPLAELPNCTGRFPTLQIGITVVDTTGFAFTKQIATCASGAVDFGGFSDYGTTAARFSITATAPVTAFGTRGSPTGYLDSFVSTLQPTFDVTLPAADGDTLALMTNPNLPLPTGTRVKARVEGGGGTFAESTIVAAPSSMQPLVWLNCCGPRAAVSGSSSSVDVALQIFSPGTTPAESFTYDFRITDPVTGTVVGRQSGTTYSQVNFPLLKVQRGHVIEMDVTPNHPRGSVDATASLGPSGGSSVRALSNEVGTPARFRVACCSP